MLIKSQPESIVPFTVCGKDKEVYQCQKKYRVRAECPQFACGAVSHLSPETLHEKFIGDEEEIEILCPLCGTKHKAVLEEDKD